MQHIVKAIADPRFYDIRDTSWFEKRRKGRRRIELNRGGRRGFAPFTLFFIYCFLYPFPFGIWMSILLDASVSMEYGCGLDQWYNIYVPEENCVIELYAFAPVSFKRFRQLASYEVYTIRAEYSLPFKMKIAKEVIELARNHQKEKDDLRQKMVQLYANAPPLVLPGIWSDRNATPDFVKIHELRQKYLELQDTRRRQQIAKKKDSNTNFETNQQEFLSKDTYEAELQKLMDELKSVGSAHDLDFDLLIKSLA
jgi:hypothetical protein